MLVVLAFASKPLNFTGRNYHVPGEVVISSVYSGIVMTTGKDKLVLQWSIEDHITGIQEPYPSRAGTPTAGGGRGSWTTGGGGSDLSDASSIAPRGVFKGHSDTVEDVQFRPSRLRATLTTPLHDFHFRFVRILLWFLRQIVLEAYVF
jgi:hypothetical protein